MLLICMRGRGWSSLLSGLLVRQAPQHEEADNRWVVTPKQMDDVGSLSLERRDNTYTSRHGGETENKLTRLSTTRLSQPHRHTQGQ